MYASQCNWFLLFKVSITVTLQLLVRESRIYERTISLRVLGLKVCLCMYKLQSLHYKPVSNYFCSGGGGDPFVEVTVNARRKTLTSKNSASARV